MYRILIVKTSSMGDVIHNFPIVSDLKNALPHATVDWVVEEAYADLVRMHAGVKRVIPVALRRWRNNWCASATRRERCAFKSLLQQQAYDAVLDTQGLLKSALISYSARLQSNGVRIGYAWPCAREKLASWFYQRRYCFDPSLHAIERLRSLAAQAFHYSIHSAPQFGLIAQPLKPEEAPWLQTKNYAVMLHATARPEKTWRSEYWQQLGDRLAAAQIQVIFPWGTASERVHATSLASTINGACAAPRLTLPQAARLLAGARLVVGVDTGLTHLAAALNSPTIALFGATERWRYGPYWTSRALSLGDAGAQPDPHAVYLGLQQLGVFS